MTLKNRQVVEDVIHFRKIVLSPDWNNNVLNQYYLNNTATRNLFPAEFAAQAVAHMVLHGNYAGIESYSEHIGENGLTRLWLHIFVIYVLPRVSL